jgi:hypothetical protein
MSSAIQKNVWYVLFIVTISFHFSLPNQALAEDAPAYITITSENDIYAPKAQDRHYSNGLRFAYGLSAREDAWYRSLGRFTTLGNKLDRVQYELSLGQNIYTPEFYLSEELILSDRPYAGWLYGELSATGHAPGREENITINLGLVGPAAIGEKIQKFNHSIVGDENPRGWRHQLKNEPAILIKYQSSWFFPLLEGDVLGLDAITRLGINLGNVFTNTGAGLVLRAGNHLPERDLPLRLQPGLSGNSSYLEIRHDRFDWMVFTEIQGRAVLQNIFLDGNTFRDSHSVAKKPFVWDAGTGVIFGFGQFRYPLFISFSLVWRSKEFDLQHRIDNFGSAQIGLQF